MVTKKIYSPQEAEDSFKKLPPEIRALLYSTEMRNILMQVGEKHKLHLDQMGNLEAETGAVMLGFTDMNDYPQMLSTALRIELPKATEIAKDMNDRLFSKIRESMRKGSEKSVVMPSSVAASSAPTVPTKPIVPPVAPAPKVSPAADVMLTQPTVSLPAKKVEPPQTKAEASKPGPYTADPYREPAE